MSLACIVCHSVESPSHSFRSYSVSSSDAADGRCTSITNCLTRKASLLPQIRPNTNNNNNNVASSKVTPLPNDGVMGPPRLVRSRAVSRDIVRDWNFDELLIER